MIMFVRIDAQTPAKLIAAAERLTVEWCIAGEIGVANFQKQDKAVIQVSQKYIMQLAVIPVSFHYLHNQRRVLCLD